MILFTLNQCQECRWKQLSKKLLPNNFETKFLFSKHHLRPKLRQESWAWLAGVWYKALSSHAKEQGGSLSQYELIQTDGLFQNLESTHGAYV